MESQSADNDISLAQKDPARFLRVTAGAIRWKPDNFEIPVEEILKLAENTPDTQRGPR